MNQEPPIVLAPHPSSFLWSGHRVQHIIQRDGGEGAGVVRHRVGDDQLAAMDCGTATIDDVRYIPLALVSVRLQQRRLQSSDYARWVVAVEQERAEGILPHRPDTVRQHQPPGLCLDWRAAVAQLDELPGIRW